MKTAVASLLALYFLLALSASSGESPCFDESTHLTAGYLFWTRPNLEHAPENGVATQRFAALPLLLNSLRLPELDTARYAHADPAFIGRAFFFELGNPLAQMLLEARAMIALLGVLLGLLVFLWSRELFGLAGGFVSLTLFVFCPSFLAHGALVTTDVAASLGFTAATWTIWRATRVVSASSVLASTGAVALLVLTKMSFPLLLPITGLLVFARFAAQEPITVLLGAPRIVTGSLPRLGTWLALLLMHALVVIAVLWLCYDFHHLVTVVPSPPGFRRVVLDALAASGLVPQAFLQGMKLTYGLADARAAYAAGAYSMTGFRWFFPYAFAIKTPIGTLLLLLLAPLSYWLARRQRTLDSTSRYLRCPEWLELTPVLVLIAVYGVVCLLSTLNIGQRHMLPMYPPLFVLAGANARLLRTAAPAAVRALVPVLLALTMFASLSVRPHYLAYFNELVGGPKHAYRNLIDSSLDWGQDLPSLARWLTRAVRDPKRVRVYLSYFGTSKPEFYGLHTLRLPGYPEYRGTQSPALHAGLYCISASMLAGVYTSFRGPWSRDLERTYQRTLALSTADQDPLEHQVNDGVLEQLRFARLTAYLRQRTPNAYIGYSILVFDLSEAEITRALSGAPAELVEHSQLTPLPFRVHVLKSSAVTGGSWVTIVPH